MRALLVIALAVWSHAATDCGGKKDAAPPGSAATTTAPTAPPPPAATPPPTAQPAAAVTDQAPPASAITPPAITAPPPGAAADGSMTVGGTGAGVQKGAAPARRPSSKRSANGLTSDPCEGGQ